MIFAMSRSAAIVSVSPEDETVRFLSHLDGSRPSAFSCSMLLSVEPFEPEEVGGYWSTRETVEPLEVVEVGDLFLRHAEADIELRLTPSIWDWWEDIAFSTLEHSGSRLRNCNLPVPEKLAHL